MKSTSGVGAVDAAAGGPPPAAADYPFASPDIGASELDRLREEEPVSRVRVPSGDEVWLVTRHTDVKFVLTDRRFTRDLRVPNAPRLTLEGDWSADPNVMLALDGPDHARRRRPVQEHLSRRQVDGWRPQVEALVAELVDGLLAGPRPVDLLQALAYPLPARFMSGLLGVPTEDRDLFLEHGEPMVSPDNFTGDEIAEAAAVIVPYSGGLVARKRECPGDDILSALIEAERRGELSASEVEVSVYELMFGGFQTTASVICATVLLLLRQEGAWVLAADGDRVDALVEESLRLLPPADGTELRRCLEDVEISGVLVRAGEAVLVSLRAPNRDPEAYDDPARFDPARFEARGCPTHLSYGHGKHRCVGAPLGQLMVGTAVRELARRVPGLQLGCREDELTWSYGLHERRLRALPVTW